MTGINGNAGPQIERPDNYYGQQARLLLERLSVRDLRPVPRGQEYMVLIPFMHQLLDTVEAMRNQLDKFTADTEARVAKLEERYKKR